MAIYLLYLIQLSAEKNDAPCQQQDKCCTNGGGKIGVDISHSNLGKDSRFRLCGIKGKHGYGDLTIILGTAYALMGVTVNTLKNVTKIERPDGSARNSFPSGHTAPLSWERNYCVGNIGTCRRGLALSCDNQDILS